MYLFNIYYGLPIIFFNFLSFTVAVTNSYLINRFWVFGENKERKIKNIQIVLIIIILIILANLKFLKNNILLIVSIFVFFALVSIIVVYIVKNFLKNKILQCSSQFSGFVLMTLIGLAINSVIFYSFTSFVSPFFGLSVVLWANFSKALATGISLFWNFFSYQFFIFKKNRLEE